MLLCLTVVIHPNLSSHETMLLQPRRRHRCGTLLLLLAGGSTAAASETLRGTLLVCHQAFVERLYISRRYERWFGGVAYLVLPGTAGRRRSHEATGATATVPAPEACDRFQIACFFARRGAGRDPYVAAYAQLFGQLATFARRDEPPPWLRPHWRGKGGVTGAVVAHLDFWLDPPSFAHRVATNALDLKRPWTLAAGLNRPPDDKVREVRVFGRYCLGGTELEEDREWTWGHDAKSKATSAWALSEPKHSKEPEACAAWADLFYLPFSMFAAFAELCGTHFKFHHEVAVPTALRFLEVEGRAPAPQFLNCWGCSQAWAKDPAVVNQHACGHRLDLGRRHVRDAFRYRLAMRPFARDAVLESQIYELDAEQGGPWDGKSLYWETARGLDKWTSGCCRLPSVNQTACGCVGRDPPRDAAAPVPCHGAYVPSTVVG